MKAIINCKSHYVLWKTKYCGAFLKLAVSYTPKPTVLKKPWNVKHIGIRFSLKLKYENKYTEIMTLTDTGKLQPENCTIRSALCDVVITLITLSIEQMYYFCAASKSIRVDVFVLSMLSAVGTYENSQEERKDIHKHDTENEQKALGKDIAINRFPSFQVRKRWITPV